MEEDVGAAGADGFADADFVSAFGDGNEHDVHDADATDDERDRGDEGEHAGNDGEEGAGGVGDFVAGKDGKILCAGPGICEFGGDGVYCAIYGVGSGDFGVDLLNLKVGECGNVIGIDDEGMVKIDIIEVDGVAHGVKNTDDHELFI